MLYPLPLPPPPAEAELLLFGVSLLAADIFSPGAASPPPSEHPRTAPGERRRLYCSASSAPPALSSPSVRCEGSGVRLPTSAFSASSPGPAGLAVGPDIPLAGVGDASFRSLRRPLAFWGCASLPFRHRLRVSSGYATPCAAGFLLRPEDYSAATALHSSTPASASSPFPGAPAPRATSFSPSAPRFLSAVSLP